MSDQGSGQRGARPSTPARGNITPPGHKNIRVFVPLALWYQCVANSAASAMGLQDYVVAVLERATPLFPSPGPAGGGEPPAGVPGRGDVPPAGEGSQGPSPPGANPGMPVRPGPQGANVPPVARPSTGGRPDA